MENHNAEHDNFRQICTEHGMRCTPQRFAVYSYMRNCFTHPDVETIWNDVKQQIPSITRESVFRILNELAEIGIIRRMDRIINARFDGTAKSHGHLICEKCGSVADFELPRDFSVGYEKKGFQFDYTEVRVCGLCEKCAAEAKENAKRK